jgi:hypothetical protein
VANGDLKSTHDCRQGGGFANLLGGLSPPEGVVGSLTGGGDAAYTAYRRKIVGMCGYFRPVHRQKSGGQPCDAWSTG